MSSDRRLLIDSDAFQLLAGARLLERAAELLGADLSAIERLAPLPHMLRKQRERGDVRSRKALELALSMCERTSAIDDETGEPELLTRLVSIDRIDGGEALLLAVAVVDASALVISGDKKALVALAGANAVDDVREALAGRIVCMETLWLALLDDLGAEEFRDRCWDLLPSHATLRLVLSQTGERLHEKFAAGFASYERGLHEDTGERLLFRF